MGNNNEDKENDDDDDIETRKDRFNLAYRAAMESDSQGYISNDDNNNSKEGIEQKKLSWKEINAISWAAFSSHATLATDETYRVYAMDMDRITNRLKLATFWLSDVLLETEEKTRL